MSDNRGCKCRFLLRYPLSFSIYFFLFFIVGVIFAFVYKNVDYIPQLIIGTICAALLCFIAILVLRFNNMLVLVLAFCGISLVAGYIYTSLKYYDTFKYPIGKYAESIDTVKGFQAKVVSYDGLRDSRHVYTVNVDAIRSDSNWYNHSSKIRLYHYGDNMLGINDIITSRAKIRLYTNTMTNEGVDNERIISMLEYKSLVGVATSYNYNNIVVVREGFSVANILSKHLMPLRYFIKKALGQHMTSLNYSVAQCLLIGDKYVLPYPIQEIFQKVGIAHIFSVSGLHVSIVYFLLFFILSRLPINFYVRISIVSVFIIVFYLPITLYSIPILRSSLMMIAVTVAMLFDRTRNILNILLLTAFIIVFDNPDVVKEISFQFSFLATFSLIVYMPMLAKLIKPLPSTLRYIIDFFAVCIFANMILLPLASAYFGTITLTSLIANIYAVPLTFAIIVLDIIIVILYAIHPPLTVWFANLNDTLVDMMLVFSRWLGDKNILRWEYSINFDVAVSLTFVMIVLSLIFYYLFHRKSFNYLMR